MLKRLWEKLYLMGFILNEYVFLPFLLYICFSSFLGFPIIIPVVFNIFKRIPRNELSREMRTQNPQNLLIQCNLEGGLRRWKDTESKRR